jgi:hypothetical protein
MPNFSSTLTRRPAAERSYFPSKIEIRKIRHKALVRHFPALSLISGSVFIFQLQNIDSKTHNTANVMSRLAAGNFPPFEMEMYGQYLLLVNVLFIAIIASYQRMIVASTSDCQFQFCIENVNNNREIETPYQRFTINYYYCIEEWADTDWKGNHEVNLVLELILRLFPSHKMTDNIDCRSAEC